MGAGLPAGTHPATSPLLPAGGTSTAWTSSCDGRSHSGRRVGGRGRFAGKRAGVRTRARLLTGQAGPARSGAARAVACPRGPARAGALLVATLARTVQSGRIAAGLRSTRRFYVCQAMTAGDIYTVAGGGKGRVEDGGPATGARLLRPRAWRRAPGAAS